MIRVAVIGDRHISRRSQRYNTALNIWDAAIADAIDQHATAFVGLGDVLEGIASGEEAYEIGTRYQRMRAVGPTFEALGNHCEYQALRPFTLLGIEVAWDRVLFRDLGPACILVIPYPRRHKPPFDKLPETGTIAESMHAAAATIGQAVKTAATLANGKPLLVFGHWTVTGLTVGDSDYEIHAAHEVTVPVDALTPAALVVVGHIHRAQEIAPNIVGAGSLYRTSFAEANDPKSYVLITVDDAGRISWTRRPVPARTQIVEEHTWSVLRAILTDRPDAMTDAIEYVRGAEVKWIVSIPEAQLATFDLSVFAPIKDAAALFTLEKRVLPTQRTRAPQLAAVHTLPAALGTWAAATGIAFDDARRARVGAKCAEIEE